jgi:hypothetical protein
MVNCGVHADSGLKIVIKRSQVRVNMYLWSVWNCILVQDPALGCYLGHCSNKNAWNFWHMQSSADIVLPDMVLL